MSLLSSPHQTCKKPGIGFAFPLDPYTIQKGGLIGVTVCGHPAPMTTERTFGRGVNVRVRIDRHVV